MNPITSITFIIIFNLIIFINPIQANETSSVKNQSQINTYDIDEVSLAHFYNQPNSSYLWLKKQQPTRQAFDALDFIASSFQHGLNPENYHYKKLQKIDLLSNHFNAELFDYLLTDGLLKLMNDLAVGRLNPTIVDPQWFIPKKQFDAIAFLQQALLSNNFRSKLDTLAPTTKQYLKIKTAASRYQSFVDRGGWIQIPATPLLRPGDFHTNIPLIRERLAFEDNLLSLTTSNQSTHFDSELTQAVQRFQYHHGLKIDGIIGTETRRAMNITAQQRLQQIKISLERLRWLPKNLGTRYLLVNLANYRLAAIEDSQTKLDMRVIVGRHKRPTPSFVGEMTHIVFNPYWNIPRKLARLDLLPKQQANPNYFYLNDIHVFTTDDGQRTEVDPYSIDWHSVSHKYFPYTLRQDPGEQNALGQLKFMFPNPWDIYLHDTPNKSLFDEAKRSLSSGCIRVEDPVSLANFSLTENNTQQSAIDIINSNENRGQRLRHPLTVYAIYITVWLDGDKVIFSPDSYLRDQKIAEYL